MRGASSRASGTARHVKLAPAPTRRGLLPADGGHRLRRAPPSRGRAARARAERNAEMLTHTPADGPVWVVGEGDRLPRAVALGRSTRHTPRRHSGPTCYRTREAESAKMARRGHCRFRGSPCAFPRVHTCSPPAHAQSHAPQPAGPRRGPLRAPRPGGLAGARGPAGPSPAPGGVRAASPGAERGLRDGCLCPRARPADALPPGRASRT